MAIPPGGNNRSLSCLRFFLRQQQRNLHAFAEEGQKSAEAHPQLISDVIEANSRRVRVDKEKWKVLDSRTMGIEYGVIPKGPWKVLNILRKKGFDAYLVGGCVRDLLLKKTPKDFDVITNASLKEIKKEFHRAEIVGRRFPICMVHVHDSVTEVSSFETVARHEQKNEIRFSQAPSGCQIKDFTLWRNSSKRDFTINSLFLNPFLNKVYDYSGGISDLRFLILRTIIPAKVSFEEDCARILRGLRIAARLGLSFSKETEAALHKLSPSIAKLAKARLFMEVNYMLSYGAAEPSLCLLQKFNLLEILLPLQAVYLEQQQSKEASQNSTMLMKLFSNLDKVASCDHPSDCRLWIGVLALHLTLVNNPQDAFVVLTLASILYHGEWKEGIRYARENADIQVHFKPELSGKFASKSDQELANGVSLLAAFVQDSVRLLTEEETLLYSMLRYPTSSSSALVFTPRRIGQDVAGLFQMLAKHNPSDEKRRKSFDIHYQLLGKGHLWEMRFVLGKIVLETMGCKTWQRDAENLEDDKHKLDNLLKNREQTEKVRKNSAQENASEAKLKSDERLKTEVGLLEGDIFVEKEGETNESPEDKLTSKLGNMSEKKSTETSQSSGGEIAKEKKGDYEKKRKSKSKDEIPRTDQRRESPDCRATEQEKGGDVKDEKKKKKQRKHSDGNEMRPELVGKKVTEKKSKSKAETPRTDQRPKSPDIKVKEQEKADDAKVKKKQRELKNRDENEMRTGVVGKKATEKKTGGVKKTKKSKSERPVTETITELAEDEKIDKKKKGGEKQEIKSKIVGKQNKTLLPLSRLFLVN